MKNTTNPINNKMGLGMMRREIARMLYSSKTRIVYASATPSFLILIEQNNEIESCSF